jgi:hypothetical protein
MLARLGVYFVFTATKTFRAHGHSLVRLSPCLGAQECGCKRRNNFLSEPVWPQVSRVSSYRCRETTRFIGDQRIVEKSSYVGSLLSALFAGWKEEEL